MWCTGQTSETIQVDESGVYSAEITVETCRTYIDSIDVLVGGGRRVVENVSLCWGDSVRIGDRFYQAPFTLIDTVATAGRMR